MKIKMLKARVAGGKARKEKEVVEVSDSEARYLIVKGSAESAEKTAKAEADK